MERKIGEIFTLDANEFKVLESKDEFCFDCYFYKGGPKCSDSIVRETIGVCEDSKRKDKKNIVFIKVDDMGTNKRGKLIYQPSGAAAEYAKWACNLYNGCSNRCEYCYNRHSQGSKLLGKDEPTIKGGMSEEEALDLFKKEFYKFEEDIKRDGGLFFNFVSDPCIPETFELNFWCIDWCVINRVPVVLLTKNADWIYSALWQGLFTFMGDLDIKYLINFGFTLTGRDDLEPGASSNKKRIESIAGLYNWGFRTWASIEPIIDPFTSYDMFKQALPYCEEFRFGLNSMKRDYSKSLIREFKLAVEEANKEYGRKLVWKESVLRFI